MDFTFSLGGDENTKEIEFEILEAEFGGCHEMKTPEQQKINGQWCVVQYLLLSALLHYLYWPTNGNKHFHRGPRRTADSHRSTTSVAGYKLEGGTHKGFDFSHLKIGRTPLQTLRSSTTSLQLTTASWIWRPTTPLWKYFVMILGRFGTERQRLSQRDRIRRTGCGTEHRRYYSKAHLKVSELDDAERKGHLTVDHDGHVVLKSARQRSSRYGIFICLELRKDSGCVCGFSFPSFIDSWFTDELL